MMLKAQIGQQIPSKVLKIKVPMALRKRNQGILLSIATLK